MRRERLEASIDRLFSIQFQDSKFLGRVVDAYSARLMTPGANSQLVRVQGELEQLKQKRIRLLDAYLENLINRDELDRRIAEIEVDTKFYQDLAVRAETPVQSLTADVLANVLSPFYAWEFLSNREKRRLLQASIPEIYVRNYQVEGLTLLGSGVNGNEINHTDRDSSLRPA
jgi:hypothetical protein